MGTPVSGLVRSLVRVLWLGTLAGLMTGAALTSIALVTAMLSRSLPISTGTDWLRAAGYLFVVFGAVCSVIAVTASLLLGALFGLTRRERLAAPDFVPQVLGAVGGASVAACAFLWLGARGRLPPAAVDTRSVALVLAVAVLGLIVGRLVGSALRACYLIALRHAAERGATARLGLVIGFCLAALGVAVPLISRPLLGAGKSQPALHETARPARQLVLVAVNGIHYRQLRYWIMLKKNSTIAEFKRAGASTRIRWPDGDPAGAWMSLATGRAPEELAGTGVFTPGGDRAEAAPERIGLRGVVRWAMPLQGARKTYIGTETGRVPAIWDLVSLAGGKVELFGWPNARPPEGGWGAFVGEHAFAAYRKVIEGRISETGSEPEVYPSERASALRRAALAPWEDWRRGAEPSAVEAAVLRGAAALGVNFHHFLRDRFYLNALEESEPSEHPVLRAIFLSFPYAVARAGLAEDEGRDAEDKAVYAFLDYLDEELRELRATLPPGAALALVVAPPAGLRPAPPGLGALLLFGEKVAQMEGERQALDPRDVTVTLLYLLGLKLSEEIPGQVAWSMLSPTVKEHFPPVSVPGYRGLADPAAGRPGGSPGE